MKRFAIVALVAAAGVVPTGLAQTVPPWARDGTGALNPMVTCAEWTHTGTGLNQSDWLITAPGVQHGPALPGTSFSSISSEFGVADVPSAGYTQFSIILPNFIDNLPEKWFFVEFRCVSQIYPPTNITLDWNDGGNTGSVPPTQLGLTSGPPQVFRSTTPGGPGWWIIQPNPDYETLSFRVPRTDFQPPTSGLNGITIYTISIPSAGSVALMAAGLPLVLRRRR